MEWTKKIELPPFLPQPCEHRVDRRNILGVARKHKVRTKLLGERGHALQDRLALIGEGELRAMLAELSGDAIGDRMVVGDPHHEAALALHQTF